MVSMFEEERNLTDGYDLSQVFDWIDEFKTIEVFVFESSLLRYQQFNREKLKELIYDKLSTLWSTTMQKSIIKQIRRCHQHKGAIHIHVDSFVFIIVSI